MQDIDQDLLKRILEGALLAAARPLSLDQLQLLFVEDEERDEKPEKDLLRAALQDLQADCRGRGYELKEVASGWRFQVIEEVGPWVSRLWDEKPQKYSRALLETLALIAYRQPITRGDIEEVRGVTVSSNIIKTLMEREWVKVVGHRDVPGRPALYATTRHFLDYFNLKSLEHLPTLAELRDFNDPNGELQLEDMVDASGVNTEQDDAVNSVSVDVSSDEGSSAESDDNSVDVLDGDIEDVGSDSISSGAVDSDDDLNDDDENSSINFAQQEGETHSHRLASISSNSDDNGFEQALETQPSYDSDPDTTDVKN